MTIIIFSVLIRFTGSTKKINETVAAQPVEKNYDAPVDKITAPVTNETLDNLASQRATNKKLNNAASEPVEKKYNHLRHAGATC